MKLANIVLVVGGTLTGLFAGLLYAFSVAIVPALRSMKGTHHIAAMQAINVKIRNPVFFLSFFGPAILLPVAAWLHRNTQQFGVLALAALLHIAGGIGVTAGRNLPLNDELAKLDVSRLSEADADQIRTAFRGADAPWMRWHTVRTLAAIGATVLVVIASLSKVTSR